MTPSDLRTLDTIGSPDYIEGYISDDGSLFHSSSFRSFLLDAQISIYLTERNPRIQKNPIVSGVFHRQSVVINCVSVLPSVVHPSYPFGNPLSTKHPASRPKRPFEPSSRALFEDMVPLGAGVNGFLRWKELGIDGLLPIDEDAEKAAQAESARKMANGAQGQNPPPAQVPPSLDPSVRQNDGITEDEEEVDEADEDEDEDDDDDEEEAEEEEEEEEEGSGNDDSF
jgi:hypothetical protein